MGQYDLSHGGMMYLVETVDDVQQLAVKNPNQLFYVTQTTLSMDDTAIVIAALRDKFPNIRGPKKDDICYATQNRQDAVRELAQQCDLLLVVGSSTSSNSNRLRELAERLGADAYLIDSATDIDPQWLVDKAAIGVSAGASAPEILVDEVLAYLQSLGASEPQQQVGVPENITFSMPKDLRSSVK